MSKITDTHPEYDSHINKWSRCRDAVEGSDRIKGQGIKYLPKLPGQSADEYNSYKDRALWYNATGRTLDGLTGLVFSKPPEKELPAGGASFYQDSDLRGKPLDGIAEDALEEVISIGRYGILVDHPQIPEGKSQADAELEGLRPYLVGIRAESITNWDYSRRGGHWILSRVVIKSDGVDFEGKPAVEYKELILAPEYHVMTWRRGKDEKYEIAFDVVPIKHGLPLQEIPFFFFGPEFGDWCVDKPPLLDLVDINISHYRTMADLEHGRFFIGLPTPIFAGFNFEEGQTIKLGSMTGISANESSAKWGYLEFQGQGLQVLENAALQKELMMAKLGSRMLTEDKNAVEAAETIRIRKSGESSVLASIANSVSRTFEKIIAFAISWMLGSTESIKYQLNIEYEPSRLSSQELIALLQAVNSGQLPRMDYFRALKAGGIIADDRQFEDFQAETPEPGTGLSNKDNFQVKK